MSTLQRLLNDTARHVPFYRSHWASAGVDVGRLSLPRDFASLPIVRKSDLLAAGVQARLDDRRRRADLVVDATSGSSGQPFEVLVDPSAMRRRRLRFLRALVGAGYRPGERLMLVASRHATSLGARLLGFRYASLKQGEDALAAQYVRTRPAVLYGPLSSLLALADRLTTGHRGHHRPRLVVTTAEEVTAAQRRTLDRAFGSKIADFYGMTELGLVAWRSGAEEPYRLPATHLKLEFLPCAADDALERLVVTDLSGGAMPLIRYETGTSCTATAHCPVRRSCGSPAARSIACACRAVGASRPIGSRPASRCSRGSTSTRWCRTRTCRWTCSFARLRPTRRPFSSGLGGQ